MSATNRGASGSAGAGAVSAGGDRVFVAYRIERRQPARRTYAVDLALREHGSQPGRETAPPVKVSEERTAFAVAFLKPEKVGVNRIGQLTRAAAGVDRIGRSIEHRTILEHEMIPRRLVPIGARTGERQILEVQCQQVPFETLSVLRRVGQCLGRTSLERERERTLGHTPSRGPGLLIETRGKGRVYADDGRRLSGHDPGPRVVGALIVARGDEWERGSGLRA